MRLDASVRLRGSGPAYHPAALARRKIADEADDHLPQHQPCGHAPLLANRAQERARSRGNPYGERRVIAETFAAPDTAGRPAAFALRAWIASSHDLSVSKKAAMTARSSVTA